MNKKIKLPVERPLGLSDGEAREADRLRSEEKSKIKSAKDLRKQLEFSELSKEQQDKNLEENLYFSTMSWPLPKDHWLYEDKENVPPMPFKIGISKERTELANKIREAAKYAIRTSTMNGKEMDFDPDAMIQNMIVGMLGYWTDDGKSKL